MGIYIAFKLRFGSKAVSKHLYQNCIKTALFIISKDKNIHIYIIT